MKNIQKFKQFNEELTSKEVSKEIHEICEKYGIENYTINNGVVNVDDTIYLACQSDYIPVSKKYKEQVYLSKLPLRFGEVSGSFFCEDNSLATLDGCPAIVGQEFNCSNNELTSLEGCPLTVGGNFICMNNEIRTLDYLPKKIGGEFYCAGNPINNVYKLFYSLDDIEFFLDCDIFRDNGETIILDRLNMFLETIGKEPVTTIEGYKCI